MAERADKVRACAHPDAFLCLECLAGPKPCDRFRDRNRIVQSAERVDQDVETEGLHLLADVVCKAASEDHGRVFERDFHRASSRIDRSLKFYFIHEAKILFFV